MNTHLYNPGGYTVTVSLQAQARSYHVSHMNHGTIIEIIHQTVVVGGEEGAALDSFSQILQDGIGHCSSVVSGSATSEFVQDDQRTTSGISQNHVGL